MSPQELSKDDALFKFQCTLLVKEIEYIHSRIAHYDELSFKIKGWAMTLWSGIVAFGAKEGLALVVLASVPATMTFWIMDAYFKQYQRRSMVRMGAIESFLNSKGFFEDKGLRAAFRSGEAGNFPIHDPIGNQTRRLDQQFDERYRSRTSFWRCFTVPNVFYFYLIPLVSAFTLAFFLK
jgi:hypothetical protein